MGEQKFSTVCYFGSLGFIKGPNKAGLKSRRDLRRKGNTEKVLEGLSLQVQVTRGSTPNEESRWKNCLSARI